MYNVLAFFVINHGYHVEFMQVYNVLTLFLR